MAKVENLPHNDILLAIEQGEMNNEITPELVRLVADKVYKMIQQDLRIENERCMDYCRFKSISNG